MSSYFFQRIKNLPVAASNNNSKQNSNTNVISKSTIKTELSANISDDELLESTLKFEQTPAFKMIEIQIEKEKEIKNTNSNILSYFKPTVSSPNNKSSSSSSSLVSTNVPKQLHNSASTTNMVSFNDRVKQESTQILSTSKKRPASTDDDVIPIENSSASVVRPPVKKLPNSTPDFHTFAPPNQSVAETTKRVLTVLRSRRPGSVQTSLSHVLAREQLIQREKLMRKPKPSTNEEKSVETKPVLAPIKRKANEIETSDAKKARTIEKKPKNAFEKLVHEMTDTMTHCTLANRTITTNTSTSVTSKSAVDLTTVQSTATVPTGIPAQSMKEKPKKPKKIHTYDDYLIFILKWPVSLLDELDFEPRILYKDILGENSFPVPLLELYSSFEEYEEITLPWLLQETFEEIKQSIRTNDHKLAATEFDAVLPQIRILISGMYELKSQVLLKRTHTNNKYREMFSEDDLVVITLPEGQSINRVFGIVRSGERITDKNRLHKSYADHPDVKITPPVWICYEYNIRIFGNGMKLLDESKIKIKAITSLTATLRRFKALASMRSCPLFENLLSPSLNDPIFQIKIKQTNCMEEKYLQAYNESQQNVISEAFSMIRDVDDNQPKIYMCQGPPGTGKSQTITGIVRALIQPMSSLVSSDEKSVTTSSSSTSVEPRKKTKILICCPSNGGCNEIVRRFIDTFSRKNADQTTSSALPFKLIRCARGGGVSQDIENVSLDTLAQKRLEEVLNNGGQNEAVKRNIDNKEKQKNQLLERIANEKKKLGNDTTNDKMSEELKDLELNLKEITKDIEKLKQNCRKNMPEALRRQREREIKLELLQDADICVSTLNYVGNSIFDAFSPFDSSHYANRSDKPKNPSTFSSLFNCLIIDEAGQCIEIDNYIPLRLGMNRIILVGDPEQLPATVLSRRALEAGLNQSLFERLYKLFKYDVNNPIRMLNIQYRMHDEICRFPSMHIYRSKLKTDKLINQKRKKFLLKPYMVLDVVHGQEYLDSTTQSYGNPHEANIIVCLIQFITERAKVPFNQIGIITPYSYQVKLIEQKLQQENLHRHKIEIGTVDAFQGRQKDVIILSCVRATQANDSTTSSGIGFVANRQRLNVSLTRAKYAMYIIGHMTSLNINEDWKKLYINATERKTVLPLTSPEQFESLIKVQQQNPQAHTTEYIQNKVPPTTID